MYAYGQLFSLQLTLLYIDSVINLERFCSSLPTIYIFLVDFVVLEISNFAHVYICVCTVAVCMNNFDNIPSILHLVAMLVLFYK